MRTKAGWEVWPATRFATVREGIGWWVRKGEVTERTRRTVDTGRIGAAWDARVATRWDVVWEKTGARTAAQPKEKEDDDNGSGGGPPEEGKGWDLLEAAEEQAMNGRKEKRTKAAVTGKEVSEDAGRCGIAMAAREGELWDPGVRTRQGCPACCSHAHGYGWRETHAGKWEWAHSSGASAVQVDMMHAVCGECKGIPQEAKRESRGMIARSMRAARGALVRATRAGTADGAAAIKRITLAQKGFAKQQRATAEEKEAMRQWLAGDLPGVTGHGKKAYGLGCSVAAAVRRAQCAAAHMRREWRDAGSAESARRAAREGGREGTRWRGVGWEAWRQGMHATATGVQDEATRRHGWTMAAALIWHMQRKRAREKGRGGGAEATAGTAVDESGRGVVVFDLETTELIEEDVAISDMEASIACAAWIPDAHTAAEAHAGLEARTFWHEAVARDPAGRPTARIADMLRWFDKAKAIVAYNGRAFDMPVLCRAYAGDAARRDAHLAKLMDPMDAVRRATGRRYTLAAVLRANAHTGKSGVGSDAPRWWAEGKLARLEEYCAADTASLVDMVILPELRLPGRAVTRDASVVSMVTAQPDAGEGEEDEAGDAARANGAHRSSNSGRPEGEAPAGRSSRKRSPQQYDETVRRRPRKRYRPVYLATTVGRRGQKRNAIVMGAAALERVVHGRYEWRDDGLRPMTGARKRAWAKIHEQ